MLTREMCAVLVVVAVCVACASCGSVSRRHQPSAYKSGKHLYRASCPTNAGQCVNCTCGNDELLAGALSRCAALGCCRALPLLPKQHSYTCPPSSSSRQPLALSTTGQTVGCCPFARCAPGASCMYDDYNDEYVCCTGGADTPAAFLCPGGELTQLRCAGTGANGGCGSGSQCVTGYCCPLAGGGDQFCPMGRAQMYGGLRIPVACGNMRNGVMVRYPGNCDPAYQFCQRSNDAQYGNYEICCSGV